MDMDRNDLELLFYALQFAADHHRFGRRKGEDASPYINHPIAVAGELVEIGIDDPEILAAALLHDTVEDTDATPTDIEREFGPRVRRMVEEVTDDTSLPSAERKRLQVEHAAGLSPEAKLIKLADKTCNVRDVGHAPARGWSIERRREYLDWTHRVIAHCRGTNESLEARYDAALAEAYAEVERESA